MAVLDKTTLHTNINGLPTPITRVSLLAVLNDMVDSYEDNIIQVTTAARNALTPFQGQKIFNTDNLRLEIYSDATGLWLPCSQKTIVATDCSGNPNYPQGGVGDAYIVSVAGKIGGASGKAVYVGDIVYCIAQNAGGTEAAVGASWQVCYSASTTDVPTRYTEITLSSAEILNGNSARKLLVAAPGAGKIIMPIDFLTQFTYSTAPYATNTNGRVGYDTGANFSSVMDLSAGASYNFIQRSSDMYPIADKAIYWDVATGNPTGGSGTAKLGIYYKIHTL